MRQYAAMARVTSLIRSGNDGINAVDRRCIEFAVLWKCFLPTCTMAIDVFPGLCRVEGQLVGRDANDGTWSAGSASLFDGQMHGEADRIFHGASEGDRAACRSDSLWNREPI